MSGVLERYDVGEPPPGGVGVAVRYWALPGRILVGGRLLTLADGQHLRATYGVTHVLSAQDEQGDEHCVDVWGPGAMARHAFPDHFEPPPQGVLRGAVRSARAFLQAPGAVLYTHCRLGGSRGPAYAYLALRLLGYAPDEAEDLCGRQRVHGAPVCPAYRAGIEAALAAEAG